ncbi:VOC family protein [Pseudoteredinibacter isoporae]|uniref:VOC family protein n=1 Tax=Pseudoteredinibacter isoporae TaxID=570281 RepID=UPI0031047D8D
MVLPADTPRIVAYFFVQNAQAFIEFTQQAFAAEELGREEAQGMIRNAQLRILDCTFMVSEATEIGPLQQSHYLYVDDVDHTLEQALKAGAECLFDAEDMPYGDRQGGIKDPFGNYWWVSKRLTEEPYYPLG